MCMMTICINMDLSHESKLNFKPTYPKCLALVNITFCCKKMRREDFVENFPYSIFW